MRKSSEAGLEQEFNSLDAQREACEAYIRSQTSAGWFALPITYDDGGISDGPMDRPDLQRWLANITADRFDTDVDYRVDRLTLNGCANPCTEAFSLSQSEQQARANPRTLRTKFESDDKNYFMFLYQLAAWRRGRDSNPRYPCEYAAFRVRCFQPLSHLSGTAPVLGKAGL